MNASSPFYIIPNGSFLHRNLYFVSHRESTKGEMLKYWDEEKQQYRSPCIFLQSFSSVTVSVGWDGVIPPSQQSDPHHILITYTPMYTYTSTATGLSGSFVISPIDTGQTGNWKSALLIFLGTDYPPQHHRSAIVTTASCAPKLDSTLFVLVQYM